MKQIAQTYPGFAITSPQIIVVTKASEAPQPQVTNAQLEMMRPTLEKLSGDGPFGYNDVYMAHLKAGGNAFSFNRLLKEIGVEQGYRPELFDAVASLLTQCKQILPEASKEL